MNVPPSSPKHQQPLAALRLLTNALGLIALTFLLSTAKAADEKPNYGEVAKTVATMLEREHFSNRSLDDSLSQELLRQYLKALDSSRVYFLKSDITSFEEKFATQLDDLIKAADISAAFEIFEIFKSRVTARISKVHSRLDANDFDFTSDRRIPASRKKAAWPISESEADEIWDGILINQMISERIRRTDNDEKQNKESEKSQAPGENIRKRYQRVLRKVNEDKEADVVNHFLSALARTYDPHTSYLSPPEKQSFSSRMQNELIGIGVQFVMTEGAAEIRGIMVGGPADRQGELQLKDRIIGIGQDNEGLITDILQMPQKRVIELVRGKIGSFVRLKVVSAQSAEDGSGEAHVIKIRRDRVKLTAQFANAELIKIKTDDDGTEEGKEEQTLSVGWINLPLFYTGRGNGSVSTAGDIRRLLDGLMKHGIDGLVLDLRNNGGGSLQESIDLSGLFVQRGAIVQSKNNRRRTDFLSSRTSKPVYSGPMIVLTGRTSASASEIVAAALQDRHRAIIIGDTSTFGKGTAQTIHEVAPRMPEEFQTDRAGAIKVTFQKFYRITGAATQLNGVTPNIILPSRRDYANIGEATYDTALPYNEIRKRRYRLFREEPFPIEELTRRSRERVDANMDFQYVVEDTNRNRKEQEENLVSLNAATRKELSDTTRERSKKRRVESRERYAKIESAEQEKFAVYEVTLDNVDDEKLSLREDISEEERSGLRVAKDDKKNDAENGGPPKFPHGFDPTKRETLDILVDFIGIENAKRSSE